MITPPFLHLTNIFIYTNTGLTYIAKNINHLFCRFVHNFALYRSADWWERSRAGHATRQTSVDGGQVPWPWESEDLGGHHSLPKVGGVLQAGWKYEVSVKVYGSHLWFWSWLLAVYGYSWLWVDKQFMDLLGSGFNYNIPVPYG